MPHFSTPALVINKKTTKEADLLITLLTPTRGKIYVTAKGAQNIKSSRLSSLQLGNTIKAQIYQKNNHAWLSESVTQKSILQSQKNLSQLNLLFYLLEIINRFIATDQHTDQLYDLCQQLIDSISKNQFAHFIHYQIKLIELLGFGPPDEIITLFADKEYRLCQQQIYHYLESIIDRPFQSSKLFSA